MKKRKNKLGLKGLLLAGGLTLASIFPGKAQEEPSERYAPFNFHTQPNTHLKLGRNFYDWYGSGDVNNDEVIDYQDYEAIMSTPSDRSDIDGDGTPSTEADKEILGQYLDGEISHSPGHWNELSSSEKVDWYLKMEDIYQRDLTAPIEGDCTERSRNRFIDFSGFANFENSPYFSTHENTTNNARFNIPMLMMYIYGSDDHAINVLYAGEGEEGDVTENLIDSYLHIENNGVILNPRDYVAITESSEQHLVWQGYVNWDRGPPLGEGSYFALRDLVNWELDENLEAVVDEEDVNSMQSRPNIIQFDPLKYDTISFEGVPENKLVNYKSDLNISESLEEKVDSVYSKLKPIKTADLNGDTIVQYVYSQASYENSEKINLGQEYEGEFYNYKFVRKAVGETPWIKDSISWEIEVKDIEPPKINNFPEDEEFNYSTSLDLENYVVPENLEAVDNSELEVMLEKSTESTQVMDGTVNQVNFDFYTDITAKDKFDNDTTYTHKTEVRDTEAPKINNFPEDEEFNYSTSLDLENYVVPENLEAVDNSELEVMLEKSTESTQVMDGTVNQVNFDFYTDITARDKASNDTTYKHKTEVRDTENPSGNLTAYYVQRESGQSAEDAVKTLVENVYDNSELPVDTLVEQTSEKYYDVFLKDVIGNESYLGNVEADYPVGTGDDPSELENKCKITPYPNPNPRAIKYYQPDFGETEISVYDMSGRMMKQDQYNSQPGENNVSYDFDLAQGVYTITMDSETCKDSEKIVVDGRK